MGYGSMGWDWVGWKVSLLTMVCWGSKVVLPDITSPRVDTPPIWTAKGMRWEVWRSEFGGEASLGT